MPTQHGALVAAELSREMLAYYIASVANRYIANNDLPPDTVDGYASMADQMIRQMRIHGDEGALKLGIEYRLGHPEIDTEPLAESPYTFDDADIRELLRYIHKRAWPDQSIPAKPPDVYLVEQPLMEWWARTDRPKI
jgi:hypothetical protein